MAESQVPVDPAEARARLYRAEGHTLRHGLPERPNRQRRHGRYLAPLVR